ncbi:MAG: hypothetical protein PHV23_03905 [Candidatus Gracilibacteria bacterium]|nr:hypothetical protein [Candidatus Gracilibacteria bacterium]
MKTFVKLLVILYGVLNITSAAYVEEDPYVGKSNIEKTILIEKYLQGHKEKIVNFSMKYDVENDIEIKNNIDKINYLIESLNKIQNNNLGEDKENLLISTILSEIKKVNDSLKTTLQKKKDTFESNLKAKKDFYSNLGYKLSFKIEEIYNVIYDKNLFENNYLNEKETMTKNALIEISSLSKDLKYFSYKDFETQKQIQDEFILILKDIRKQILILKKSI